MTRAATITAAAARWMTKIVKPGTKSRQQSARDKQAQAYSYWFDTPEVRFSGVWVGRGMSRCRLIAGIIQPDGEIVEAPESHPATQRVRDMAGGRTGQSQLLEQIGIHLVVSGEPWVVIKPEGEGFLDAGESWHVVAPIALKEKTQGGLKGWEVEIDDEDVFIPPADVDYPDSQAVGIRIWTPSPTNFALADSPVMGSFTILEELRLLNAAVAAIATSRLGGRGILGIPAGAKLPDEGDLLERILEVAEAAYKDPSSAAAIVPILLELPPGSELKKVTFESQFDELAIQLRQECIRRFATAADVPAEMLTGQGDMNHWGVWAQKEEAIQVGIEPRMATACDGLTQQWLWPDLGDDSAIVWYDATPLKTRSNQSETAIQVYDRRELSGKALRDATGFEDSDAPAKVDEAIELALTMVRATPSLAQDPGIPQLVRQLKTALAEVGVGSKPAIPAGPVGPVTPPEVELPVDETQSPPTDMPSPGQAPPDQSDANLLASAVDQTILRALEKAGHKMRKAKGRSAWASLRDVPAYETHTKLTASADQLTPLLAGAWDTLPRIAVRHGIEEQCLRDTLDEYCRELLQSGTPHRFEAIPVLIRQASCLALA